jgi:hypothetical protein
MNRSGLRKDQAGGCPLFVIFGHQIVGDSSGRTAASGQWRQDDSVG